MNISEGLNYVLFNNPASSTIIGCIKGLAQLPIFKTTPSQVPITKLPPMLENLPVPRLVLSGNFFVRLAGLSGATAVVLGAYGAHSIDKKVGYDEQKKIYETANKFHFINSLALLGVPLCRYPVITGSLLTLGMFIFCGSCYYNTFTGEEFKKLMPVGGTILIFGWICFMF